MKRKALALFSGGLDSILACKLVEQQGVEVEALHFITPFFGCSEPSSYVSTARDKYGIELSVIDAADDFLKTLAKPSYGYGSGFNPCIDCKILLLDLAKRELVARKASFLISGEVLGQRPMSQNRSALDLIGRKSSAGDLLVRPLSALCLPPTEPEREGWVDRSKLAGIQGRSRKHQMNLAATLGITEYPAPAGGCVLTDPVLSKRIRKLFGLVEIDGNACRLMQVGRHFFLPNNNWLILGRNEAENNRIEELSRNGDLVISAYGVPGPTGLLRGKNNYSDRVLAGSILGMYTKLRNTPEVDVRLTGYGVSEKMIIPPSGQEAVDACRA
ncbi:MAG: hypothetical protein V1736_06170 [Pseudomonadota bacterium]